MALQHVVLFSFPSDLSAEDEGAMRSQIESWVSDIGLMDRLRFGTDLTGARTRGYHYLLYSEFADEATLEAYRAHPVHQAFVAWCAERSCTALAFDYHLDATTVLGPEPGSLRKESA